MNFLVKFVLRAFWFSLAALAAEGRVTGVVALGYNLGPTPPDLTNITAVGVVGYSVLALRGDGSVAEWGNSATDPGVSNLVSISSGWGHVVGFTPQGKISGYGDDSYGEISGFPASLTNAAALTAGYYVTFAIRPDGSLIAAGDPGNPVMQIPPDASNVVALATVNQNAIALRANGTVVDWHDGTTNLHPEFSNVVAVATDGFDDAVLFYDGTIAEWPGGFPDGLTNLTALTGGDFDFLALRQDGVPFGWGANRHGEVDIPAELTNVTAFAINGSDGYSHTIFLIGGTNGPPSALKTERIGGTTRLQLTGVTRRRYVLEESTDLATPAKWNFKQNILLGSRSQSFDFPINPGARFFRARLMP